MLLTKGYVLLRFLNEFLLRIYTSSANNRNYDQYNRWYLSIFAKHKIYK